MQGGLVKSVQDKISSFDVREPYVWRLKLSEMDFNYIETYLNDVVSQEGILGLSKSENAITTVVFIAEWYKRRYQSGNKNGLIEGLDFEQLWYNAGLNKKLFLYHDENGNNRWLYSTYVLGGLAIQHELNRNDNMRFLKGLCRIYHGENYSLENLDESSRAIAFRESIKSQHSLYEYLKDILNGNMPFDKDELANESSDVNRFIATIKAANDEILKVKFRFEWNVSFSPDYTCMTRRLNVWLKPEEVGGQLYQYLRFDRVHLWGIPNPEKQLHLYVYIRFMNGDEVVEPSTMDKPIITYLNHGVNDFVAFGVERRVLIKHIPTIRFSRIEIIIKDDWGNEYLAQSQETSEFIQVWRSDIYSDTWTSTQNSQRETALVFSNNCQLLDETISEEVFRKCFKDQLYGTSEIWNWVYIYDSVSFLDEKGKKYSLFNRIGYDQITTKLYSNTIRYFGGGKAKHYYIDDPEISDEYEVDELPLIFGWDDVVVRHFTTKDDILNAQPEEDTVAELIEFKQSNGRYIEWSALDEPPYGKVLLQVTVKGKPYKFSAIYLPRYNSEVPILRDFDTMSVRYRSFDDDCCEFQDTIPRDGKPLEPVVPLKFECSGDSYYWVDIYRPTQIKEVIFDGILIKYLEADGVLNLPYIFKNRVQINSFSTLGYQAYDCKNLSSIYTQDFMNIAQNPSVGMAAISNWLNKAPFPGNTIDALAPMCLYVCFGLKPDDSNWEGQEALYWNYDVKTEPIIVDPSKKPAFGVVFQNLLKNKDLTCNFPIRNDDDPWGFDDIDTSLVKCFEVANETGTYFFLMKPLVEIQKSNIIKDLYQPLLEKRNGVLTEFDKQGLVRFGEEFGFDWQANQIYLENE